ncbi:MAG: alternate F1F0 ATPase, F1 subunit alpha [Bacillota bacterium]|nr:alternate F1F0 ATPase, F1 subunit alpha [Bacillota bacterium]
MANRQEKSDSLLAALRGVVEDGDQAVERALDEISSEPKIEESGTVTSIGSGIARLSGLTGVQADELVEFPGGVTGIAFNLDRNEVGVIMLGSSENIISGDRVKRTGRVVDIAVGDGLLGRVIDAAANPLDNRGPISYAEQRPVERPAPPIMARAPVTVPLQTGLKVVDALIPVGRGQRELILGDRQIGKTAIALDTIINQADKNLLCIYCSIGQQGADVAKFIDRLRRFGAMDYTTVVVASGDGPPGLRFIAPYAATTIAEYFMEQGRDVMVVYDDLTLHARAYRELSLLLERPPGREAYPGDIFYLHSRLLERATHLREEYGGGSLTALPIIETQAQNISAYIPTNLISITDGQIYLSPDLFQRNHLPAVDVGKSVSRVGGKTQLPAYRSVTGALRLSYAQFEELEMFARFGTRLDDKTRETIERGRRVRKVLTQPELSPLTIPEQIAVLLAVTGGLFDEIEVEEIPAAEEKIRKAVTDELPGICRKIEEGEELTDEDKSSLIETAREVLAETKNGPAEGKDVTMENPGAGDASEAGKSPA